jgi:hypothetical protein
MGERYFTKCACVKPAASSQPTGIAMEHRRAGGTRGLYLLRVRLQQQMPRRRGEESR